MTYQVLDDDGQPIDAHFELGDGFLIFHSRGGSRKGSNARNLDYGLGLRLVLNRLYKAGLSLTDALVDSSRVAGLSREERRIIDARETGLPPDEVFTIVSRRMKDIGRDPNAKPIGGNSTKRIRLEIPSTSATKLQETLGSKKVSADFKSRNRLPADQLNLVKANHLYNAVIKLLANEPHPYGPSTDYDVVLEDGRRLPPKAVFGLAASEVLGFEVKPEHFSGGTGTPCFKALLRAGYTIEPKSKNKKKTSRKPTTVPPSQEDKDWLEGKPRRIAHLKRERASGLSTAKRDAFRAKHGKLFCEYCKLDPGAVYGEDVGEACIEVHHTKPLSQMKDGDVTRLEDLQCLCASCHRVIHRKLRSDA